jgi:hemerythrin-like domain-containing protein
MPYQDPDPTDPMTFHAMGLETDDPGVHREMALAFIEEYMRMGYGRDRVISLFQIPQYIGPFLAYEALGEAVVAELVDEVAERWGGRRDGSEVRRDEYGEVVPRESSPGIRPAGETSMKPSKCSHHSGATTARGVLMEEHRVIERVLDAVERMLDARTVDAAFLDRALDFFRNFADGCHHAKEETALFPALERAGIPRLGGPVGVMLDEHVEGRRLLGIVAENLALAEADIRAADRVRGAARAYVDLLRQHIQKEDNVLFAIADQALDPTVQREVLDAFDALESREGEEDKHERCLNLAHDLETWSFDRPVAR